MIKAVRDLMDAKRQAKLDRVARALLSLPRVKHEKLRKPTAKDLRRRFVLREKDGKLEMIEREAD